MTRLIKKRVALILVLFLSIENFAAVVGDNDGAAFITKAEFDSLKNNFQSQIDQYNTSIDSKIDGAIASYLAGVKVEKKSILNNLYTQLGETVNWGNIPFVTTDLKHNLYAFVAMLWQGDDYGPKWLEPGQSRQYEVYYRFAAGSKDDIDGTGTYNMFQVDKGNYYYYGSVENEYCRTAYSFFGDLLFDWGAGASAMNLLDDLIYPAGALHMSYIELPNSTIAYPWQTASGTQEWVKTKSNVAWSDKIAYWTRADIYMNGNVTKKQNYMASGVIADTVDRSINFDKRIGGQNSSDADVRTDYSSKKTLTWRADRRISNHALQQRNHEPDFEVEMAYFYPQTYNINRTTLHSLLVKSALNRNIKLYEGLPLFIATSEGKVKFRFTIKTTNSAANRATFYLNDNEMFRNEAPVGNQQFNVWSVSSDGTKSIIGTNVTSINVSRDTNVEIELDVKKDHTYIFKLAPSDTNYYAYVDNFSDIEQTEE